MKCSVKKSDFQKEMTLVHHAVRKTNISILSFFVLEATEDKLHIFASDGELQYLSTLPAHIETEGKIVVPIRYMNDVIRSLPGEDVYLESESLPKVKIHAGSTEFILYGAHPEEFPLSLFASQGDPIIEIPASVFLEAIRIVQKAIPARSVREALVGAFFEWRENVFRMVGVDIHHVAYFSEVLDYRAPEPFTEIIHHKALNEIEYILEDEETDVVRICRDERMISFIMGQRRVGIRLIDDTFPDYTIYFLSDANHVVKVSTEEFFETMKRILLLSRELPKHTIPYFTMNVGPSSMELLYEHPVAGSARDVISCELEGDPFELQLNGRDMLDFVPCITKEKTVLYVKGEKMPVVVRPDDGRGLEEKQGIWFVTMPLTEQEEGQLDEYGP